MKFTVYETTHSYKVWKEVEADSKEALNELLRNKGLEGSLGEPDDEEVTSIEVDIYSE